MALKIHLQPNLVLGGPVIDLTPEILQKYHLKGLVLDVDETLVPLRKREVSPEVIEWVTQLRDTVPLWLVSNNLSENRIGRIAQALDLPYITGARKPSRRKLRQAVAEMNLPVERVAMVGDRLFTDVLAGNRLGMFSILVEPMVDPLKVPSHALRNMEVLVSELLGVTLAHGNHRLHPPHRR
ncbi:YqeG family HAD IIIA-type phosphatase [Oscillatoria sp. FACHB-1406]|uniref:YqeG family HAD IIIA-type phosphatase n=1 Tax=Oscillatoria sp. FACHB-1406 TaxID=2692846 RepID=UPI0016850218|nr:YqeG family HAD IIIA-type phosphatase [Oscillatoria sp. FACHB-1406]MBD2580249.1 YqeG family HAD IIIA-type phosphatase [Oscillatoria sp. FACHB-1406]